VFLIPRGIVPDIPNGTFPIPRASVPETPTAKRLSSELSTGYGGLNVPNRDVFLIPR
jgi:hypothetical protein